VTADPTRLRDDPDQPQGLRDLLDHSVRDVGSRADIARTAAKLAPLVGLGALTTSTAVKASIWAGKAWWVAGAVAGTVAVAGVAVVASGPATTPVHVPAQVPGEIVAQPAAPKAMAPVVAPPVQEPAAEEPPAPQPVVKVPARSVVLSAPTVAESSAVPAEVSPAAPSVPAPSESQLLSAAQAALASDPAKTLRLTAEHRRSFPTGAFTQEREVIEIDALYRLGRKAEADRRATQFVARNPGSSYARRVKELMTH
jgi:hypothetical protein